MSDTMAQWLAKATPDEASIRICLDRSLYRRLSDEVRNALTELERLQERSKTSRTLDEAVSDEQVRDAAQRVLEAQSALAEAENLELVFRCIPWRQWRELVSQHPPTERDKEAAPNLRPEFNGETFWPAAMAASNATPGMTVAEAEQLREVLPRDKWWEIVGVVSKVNVGGTDVPKSVSSIVGRLNSALNSTTAAPEEYPSPPSAAESPSTESPTG